MSEKEKEDFLIARSTRKIYLPVYAMIIILAAVATFIQSSGAELNDTALRTIFIFSIAGILATEIHRINNKYEITPNSLVHIKGILVKVTRKVDLLAISDADFKQNLWQMLLGYGDVEVRLFSRDSSTDVKNISSPANFVKFLEQKISQRRG
jgi:uncharacterized membrane protein YdbT with pleckstrin-like domain